MRAVLLAEAIKEGRMFDVRDAEPRRILAVPKIASDGRRGAARPSAHYDPVRQRTGLALELGEDRFGDVVVATPVRRPLREGELVHIVTVEARGERRRISVKGA